MKLGDAIELFVTLCIFMAVATIINLILLEGHHALFDY